MLIFAFACFVVDTAFGIKLLQSVLNSTTKQAKSKYISSILLQKGFSSNCMYSNPVRFLEIIVCFECSNKYRLHNSFCWKIVGKSMLIICTQYSFPNKKICSYNFRSVICKWSSRDSHILEWRFSICLCAIES